MITVIGQGSASAPPDVMRVQLGASVIRPSVVEALTASEEAVAAVRGVLTKAGVKAQDAATTGLSVTAEYEWRESRGNQLTGYRSEHQIALTLRDLNTAGQVLADALTAGADAVRLDGLNFTVDDPRPLYVAARAAAWADALARATQLAELSGCRLGDVIAITEQGDRLPPRPRAELAMASAPTREAVPKIGMAPGAYLVDLALSVQWALVDLGSDQRV